MDERRGIHIENLKLKKKMFISIEKKKDQAENDIIKFVAGFSTKMKRYKLNEHTVIE